jgi:hypothetical protein
MLKKKCIKRKRKTQMRDCEGKNGDEEIEK